MNPTKIKNLLIMAALLLVVYWTFIQPNAEGLAFSLGVLLGAGSILFKPNVAEVVLVIAVMAVMVGLIEARNGVGSQYFIGLLTGLIAPIVAFKISDEKEGEDD